jgi:hypothetical protein
MIIRIQPSGGSFLGAGKYYLHDKQLETAPSAERTDEDAGRLLKPSTDERVWFTDTRNCLNTGPERALEEMWRTAEDQAYLKMQAGVKRGGRVCEDPVKTLSLSWHKDDKPSPEHMIESADAFLKHMGWDGHQAVLVGHNDTEHRHIHIILNRVNPENGRTLDDYREQKRAQVWALAYEKEHENVRCEERELRAAKREGRAPELESSKTPGKNNEQQHDVQQAPRTPANDHLPHNVIMLSREHEQAFKAHELVRETADREQRAALKAEQRAEREAFFKDGAKEFRALRHAVYDEVRKEYAPEWREFYKDAKAAEQSAEAWSKSSVTRALYFAREGRWEEGGKAFADRDSVRDAVTAELNERKSDLKTRQTEDLRERQRVACDGLRESREIQYQELLQRQREERGAFNAGVTLEALGVVRDRQGDGQTKPVNENTANENQNTGQAAVQEPKTQPSLEASQQDAKSGEQQRGEEAAAPQQPLMQAVLSEEGASLDVSAMPALPPDVPETRRQLPDLAAGVIGSAASYLADQLGELFAPTPPEVREAQAKADAKREAEKPAAPDDKSAFYEKMIDAAIKAHRAEQTERQDEAYWKERDRGKGWERDR